MAEEMEFFIYLLENYADYKQTRADLVLRELDEKKLTDFVYDMYPLYHAEAIENAYKDIDSLLSKGKTAW